ncbi:ribosome silencing factor [Corynebacterium accolens]|uniref:Ribosomal silencing factor RsfS n=2 Tax=Corynebacteriaceae TaxID=1653 RepID=A0AAP4BXM6_9CORY|nr:MULTISPECIES: ribosome silencing factor [Corynebacterium]ERS41769.1 iojap-like ribosome-associated protein [Corynebacterium sp. KPL1996]ERS44598.1 iojap-like ribosome-associated protein [Corynebacterium sp. KPL1986]ERS72523.1 iojap-like ribosome-associated protein [Corynebacterium sp. KPL1998]ERS74018.1 iojap-like ribosome-associated protein [Corynebacterium sp. KPL2004]MCT1409450.1 ribosome silencing factor [Corynebacterium accolens]
MSISDLARRMAATAAHAAQDKLASNIAAIDVSDVLAITEVFVLASADNERQVGSIVDEVEDQMTAQGFEPQRREGNRENRWVLLDYGNIVIHVQRTDQREHYGLDRLYHDCPLVDIEGIEPPERPGDWTNGVNPRTVDSIDELPLAQKAPGEDEEL